MNWDAIGATGEIVGAAAVVVTLFYLAIQIKQSTAVSKADLFERGNESWNKATEPLLEPSNAALFQSGLKSYEDLSDIDRLRFEILLSRLILSLESGLEKHNQGFVSSDYADTYGHFFRPIFLSPGGRAYWKSEKRAYTAGMRKWVGDLQNTGDGDSSRGT